MKEIWQGIKKSDLEQWDGFRHIFKFTIFDLEEECSYTLWWVSFHTFLYKYKNHTHFPLIKNQSRVICKLHTSPSFLTRSFNLRGREGPNNHMSETCIYLDTDHLIPFSSWNRLHLRPLETHLILLHSQTSVKIILQPTNWFLCNILRK